MGQLQKEESRLRHKDKAFDTLQSLRLGPRSHLSHPAMHRASPTLVALVLVHVLGLALTALPLMAEMSERVIAEERGRRLAKTA